MIEKKNGMVLLWTAIVVVLAGLGLVMTATAYNFPEELPGNYGLTNMTDDGEVAKASYENANGYEVVVSLTRCNAMDVYEEGKQNRAVYSDKIDGVEYTRLVSFRPTVGFMWIYDNETVGLLHVPRNNPYDDVGKIIIAMQTPKPTLQGFEDITPTMSNLGVMYDSETKYYVDEDTVTIYEYSIPYKDIRDDLSHNCEQVSFSNIRDVEVLIGKSLQRWSEIPEEWYLCAWGNETHTYIGWLPPTDVKHASVYGYGPVSEVTLEGLAEMTVERTPTPPGFEAIFAIAGLLAIAYLVQRIKK